MVADLDAPYAAVQMTVTVYMFAAGLAQLVWGPASDRFGRRPVLAAGLGIFLIGSALATLAPSVGWLLAGRTIQGVGGAATIVLGRTILRDLFTGKELARNLALASAVFAAGPIVAPFAGGLIAWLFGWRAVFGLLVLVAVAALLFLLRLPETIPARDPAALRLETYGRRMARFWSAPQSRWFQAVATLGMSAMLLIIASAPRIYDESFGLRGMGFASFFAFHGFGIIVGQFVNRRLISSRGVVPAIVIAGCVLVVASSLILATGLLGIANAWTTTGLLILFATSYLVVASNSTALVLDPHGQMAGFAASIFGVVMQIGAALVVTAVVPFTGGAVSSFALALLLICLTCLALAAAWRPRSR
jgi:DHA1 family bicyclomycin/chloramphenicol resistance-like MFS transporter